MKDLFVFKELSHRTFMGLNSKLYLKGEPKLLGEDNVLSLAMIDAAMRLFTQMGADLSSIAIEFDIQADSSSAVHDE